MRKHLCCCKSWYYFSLVSQQENKDRQTVRTQVNELAVWCTPEAKTAYLLELVDRSEQTNR